MMPAYQPCTHCPLNPCARKKSAQEAVRGVPLTLVRIQCPDYRSLFKKGQRVIVDVPFAMASDNGWGFQYAQCQGTIINYRNRKWAVLLDPEEIDGLDNLSNKCGVVRAWPSAIMDFDDGKDPMESALRLARHDLGDGDWVDHEVYARSLIS